jgi:hypothetical protein
VTQSGTPPGHPPLRPVEAEMTCAFFGIATQEFGVQRANEASRCRRKNVEPLEDYFVVPVWFLIHFHLPAEWLFSNENLF